MAGRSPRHSQRGQSVRESAADIERYVSRGSNRAFVIVVFFAILALIWFLRRAAARHHLRPKRSYPSHQRRCDDCLRQPLRD